MKLNNKGFAISAILYSALILFLLIMISFLSLISSARLFSNKSTESVAKSMEETVIQINKTVGLEGSPYYITPYSGNYLIFASGKQGYIYLPKNTTIQCSGDDVAFNITDTVTKVIDLANQDPDETEYIFNNVSDTTANLDESIRIVAVYTIRK